MLESVSTSLFFSVLLLAASLASYWLSRSSFNHRHTTFAWAGISVGTGLLIGAIVLIVLSLSYFLQLRFGASELAQEPSFRPSSSNFPPNPFQEGARQVITQKAEEPDHKVVSRRNVARRPAASSSGAQPTHASFDQELTFESAKAAPPVGGASSLIAGNPWSATGCVVPIRTDPAEPDRWKVVNDCGIPVAIVIATCLQSEVQCGARGSTSWTYLIDGMMLPAKAQRSVTEAEETVRAVQLRHLACAVTLSAAVRMIAKYDATTLRSRDDFEAARQLDDCLARVRQLSETGRSTGLGIDELPGGADENARPPAL